MAAGDQQIELRDDRENHRYLAIVDGTIAGIAVYHLRGGRHIFVHTEIAPEFEGRGVGTKLARYALDDVAAAGGLVVPICPFIAGFIERHPEYRAIVDQALLDRINGTVAG